MKYPAYPNYKDSGVEWLGEVPEHWGVKRLRHIARFKGGSTPSTNNSLFWDGGNIPWVSPKDMKVGLITQTQDYLTPEGAAECASGTLEPNQVLLVVRSGILRHTLPVAINQVPVTINQDVRAIKPYQYLRPEYVRWLIEGKQKALIEQWCKPGTTVESVEMAYLLATAIPIPSVTEQEAIIAFLNRETGRIDTLVAKKRRLIALLKEQRAALISRAVTRGLPADAAQEFGLTPHTRFKDSGIDWLGEVPEGWETPPLYARYTVELGKMLNESRITGNHLVPYLRNVDVQWDGINLDDLPEMDIPQSEYQRYTVQPGDLLVCEGGEVGRAAIVGGLSSLIGYQKALHRLRASRSGEVVRFMYYTLYWAAKSGVFNAGGVSTIAHLTGEQLRKYRFPAPSHAEQTAIATYLDRETAKLDQLVEKIEAAIARLQEYRTALITAAVTGKIDVRQTVGELAA